MPIVNIGSNKNRIEFTDAYTSHNTALQKSNPTGLSLEVSANGATKVGNYVLFGGGKTYSNDTTFVDAYDDALVRTTQTSLSLARHNVKGANTSSYGIFAGGYDNKELNTVDVYDRSLVRSAMTLSSSSQYLIGLSTRNHAIFADITRQNICFVYNNSLTLSIVSSIYSSNTSGCAGAAINDFAFFAGGWSGSEGLTTVRAIEDNSLTITDAPSGLSNKRADTGGGGNTNYAIFAGGGNKATDMRYNVWDVDGFDSSLTRHQGEHLTYSIRNSNGVSSNEYALFGGGYIFTTTSMPTNVVDAYDNSLTKSSPSRLIEAKVYTSGASNDAYALFAGGASNTVDAYSLADKYILNVSIPPFSKYKFTESSQQETTANGITKIYFSTTPLSGYVDVNANKSLSGNLAT